MSSAVQFPADGSVTAALNKLQNVVEGENFLVLGYSDKITLCVIAEGPGGLNECKPYLPQDTERYILLRKDHKVEMARTVKFAYVSWTPPKLKIMRKAMLSTHKGQVKEMLRPHHVFLDCTDDSELDESIIMDKIGFSSGTKVHETKKEAYTAPKNISSNGAVNAVKRASFTGEGVVPVEVKNNAAMEFTDPDAVKAAMRAVKSDDDPTDWLLVGYENIKTLKLISTGSGGVDEMTSQLNDTDVFYSFFKVTEQYDKTVAVKFVFMKLMSQSVSPVNRAKVSTHAGFLKDYFSPVHVDFDLSSRHDINAQIVSEKIGSYTGTHSKVTQKTESLLQRQVVAGQASQRRNSSDTEYQQNHIKFEDETAFKSAIKDVRNDSSGTTWMMGYYSGKSTLSLVASGKGGLDDFRSALKVEEACFGLLRVTDKIDANVLVKFVYVRYQPNNYAPMKKGEVGTNIGAIDSFFANWHVDFVISSPDELTESEMMNKVQSASGSKSHVL